MSNEFDFDDDHETPFHRTSRGQVDGNFGTGFWLGIVAAAGLFTAVGLVGWVYFINPAEKNQTQPIQKDVDAAAPVHKKADEQRTPRVEEREKQDAARNLLATRKA